MMVTALNAEEYNNAALCGAYVHGEWEDAVSHSP
jgi:hypothetical protein